MSNPSTGGQQAVRRAFRRTVLAAVVLILAAGVAVGAAIWQYREDQVEEAKRAAGNLAAVLAEQVSYSAQAVDLVLDDVRRRVERSLSLDAEAFQHEASRRDLFEYSRNRLKDLPQGDIIAFIDEAGQPVTTSVVYPSPPTDFSDRDYFRAQTDAPAGGVLFVGEPARSKITHKWTVFFSRRVEDSAGRFRGVVVVGVQPTAFMRLDNIASSLNGQGFLLLHRSGSIYTRFPDPVDRTGVKLPAGNEWYSVVARGGGYFRSDGAFDQTARVIAVRPLENFPFVVNVASSEAYALSQWRTRAVEVAGGGLLACLCLAFLIVALNRQFAVMDVANLRFAAALNNMTQGLAMFDRDARLIVCNQRYRDLYRLTEAQTPSGAPLSQIKRNILAAGFYSGPDPETFLKSRLNPGEACKVELNDGRVLSLSRNEIEDGGFLITLADITEGARAAQEIEHLALHDPLTGLANRMQFKTQLHAGLARATERADTVAVIYMDLDRFKDVNDTLGHPVGDLLLCDVASRLRKLARASDTIARLGGDEFAIVIESVQQKADVAQLAARILAEISRPYLIETHKVQISTSLGIAFGPTDGDNPDILARHADLALYRAKAEGRSAYRLFESSFSESAQKRTSMEAQLRRAVEDAQFELHYQPIVQLDTDAIIGFEALLRWRDASGTPIPPSEFIPLAEETGLINRIGQWVVEQACREAATWPDHLQLSVNLSPIQIKTADVVQLVRDALSATGLDARRLQLEITESVLLNDTEANIAVLQQLRALGVGISMDDFGTGYSSLSYLRQFAFDSVKIDRSFISAESGAGPAVVRAVIELSRSIGMRTIGEGVETEEQRDFLRALGCTAAQGYFYSPPRPAADVPLMLSLGQTVRRVA